MLQLECIAVMSLEVSIREGESQDSLLRRFQRMVQVSRIMREVKAHRYFLSKGQASRLKARKSARRRQKTAGKPLISNSHNLMKGALI